MTPDQLKAVLKEVVPWLLAAMAIGLLAGYGLYRLVR